MSVNHADDLCQKVVLVTGGSSGIGEAIAMAYAKDGYRVAITGRNKERLDKVVDSMIVNSPSKSEENFLRLQADFVDPAQVEPIVGQVIGKYGRLDILINNAGGTGFDRNLDDSDFFEDFQNILQVNLIASMRITQLAVPHLTKTEGVIINITSIADRLAVPSVSYSVSKAGMSMMGLAVATATDGAGIRVVNVAPGPILTNISPRVKKLAPVTIVNRVGQAKEVADLVIFLTSDKASFINASTIDIDGGFLANFGGFFSKLRQSFGDEQ